MSTTPKNNDGLNDTDLSALFAADSAAAINSGPSAELDALILKNAQTSQQYSGGHSSPETFLQRYTPVIGTAAVLMIGIALTPLGTNTPKNDSASITTASLDSVQARRITAHPSSAAGLQATSKPQELETEASGESGEFEENLVVADAEPDNESMSATSKLRASRNIPLASTTFAGNEATEDSDADADADADADVNTEAETKPSAQSIVIAESVEVTESAPVAEPAPVAESVAVAEPAPIAEPAPVAETVAVAEATIPKANVAQTKQAAARRQEVEKIESLSDYSFSEDGSTMSAASGLANPVAPGSAAFVEQSSAAATSTDENAAESQKSRVRPKNFRDSPLLWIIEIKHLQSEKKYELVRDELKLFREKHPDNANERLLPKELQLPKTD